MEAYSCPLGKSLVDLVGHTSLDGSSIPCNLVTTYIHLILNCNGPQCCHQTSNHYKPRIVESCSKWITSYSGTFVCPFSTCLVDCDGHPEPVPFLQKTSYDGQLYSTCHSQILNSGTPRIIDLVFVLICRTSRTVSGPTHANHQRIGRQIEELMDLSCILLTLSMH